jgi:HD-GYP domain-containing protein (c-di-GMP phosphodiesterase class II)
MAPKPVKSYFSVSFDLLLIEENLPYDLYVNSSAIAGREKFVRIFPENGRLSNEDIETFRKKYHQLYISEDQRGKYLQSFARSKTASDVQKTEVIKDSAIVYLNKLFDTGKEFTTEILEETIEGCRDSVESMVDVIKDYSVSEVRNLIGSLSFHDFYTYDHSINVSMYCITLYQSYNPEATKEETTMVGLGGLLHDLGKIKIPTHIINNPGKLSDEDFQQIQKHPEYGGDLLEEVACQCGGDVNWNIIRRVVMEHHENVNGTGYPNKLKGDQIHIFAKITAIADFFDAITTKRSYHEALTMEDALKVMARSVDKKIDGRLFNMFTKDVNELLMKGGKSYRELPDDFDPCRPHNVLPFQKVGPEYQTRDFLKKEDKQDFGKIKTDFDDLEKEVKKKKKAS